MRLRNLLPLLLLAAAIAPAQQASTTLTQISNTWNAATGTGGWANAPLCSATVTNTCLKDLSLSFTPPGQTTADTVPGIAATATSYVFKPGGFLYCSNTASWTVVLSANYLDAQGNPAPKTQTATASVPCPFTPNPPSGLKPVPGM